LERLVEVLRGELGLDVVELPSDEKQPDGVYVADIAVVIGSVALICNPPRFNNRPSRHGEVCTCIVDQSTSLVASGAVLAPPVWGHWWQESPKKGQVYVTGKKLSVVCTNMQF